MLVVDYLDNALLNGQRDWHFEHLIIHLLVETCGGFYLFRLRLVSVECSCSLYFVLLEDSSHTGLKGGFLVRVILPILLLPLEVFDLLHLVFQIPSLSLAVHLLLLVDKLEYAAEERLDKHFFDEFDLLLLSFYFLLRILGVYLRFLFFDILFDLLFHLHFKLDLVHFYGFFFTRCSCLLFVVARINIFDKFHFFFTGLAVFIFLRLLLLALSKD